MTSNSEFIQDNSGKPAFKFKPVYFAFIFLILLLIIYTGSGISSARKKAADLNAEGDSLSGTAITGLMNSSIQLRQARYDEAWLHARVEAAGNKQFTLEISLPDSLISISYGGTSLYRIKPEKITSDRWFSSLSPSGRLALLSEPAVITRQWSTIEKEPIVIKHAPKDTAEAAAPETVPDTVMNKPVFLLFELDNAVLLSFRQAGTRVNGFHLKKGLLNSQIAMKRIQSTIQGIPAKNKRNYHPAITIDINARNAETLYRALPDSTLVVLKLYE